MRRLLHPFLIVLTCAAMPARGFSADSSVAENPPPPSAVHVQRAEKIVAALDIADDAKRTRVRDIVAEQYRDLNAILDSAKASIAAAKSQSGTSSDAGAAATKSIRAEADAKVEALHAHFLARLAAEISPEQIDQIKDGMTYGVLPLTFRVYQEMLPDLTADQKAQILAWLTEAREHAMDGGSSEEKHAWFNKYKGKITNYLTAAGYDLKKAEKEMMARRKSGAASK